MPYMVTGAVATAVYGEPRLTRDIDLVIALRSADAPRSWRWARELGAMREWRTARTVRP